MNIFKKLWKRFFAIRGVSWDNNDAPDTSSLYRKVLSIALPATIEGALLSLIGSFDQMMVGNWKGGDGEAALAAVGLTSQPRMILLILAQALCVGTTALIARRKGENDQTGANRVLSQSMALITVVGILISLAGFFLAKPLMLLAGGDQDTLGLATDYFKIISCGMIFNCWSLCLCAAMRGIGKTKITLITNMTANLVNVFLNYCLIDGHFGFPSLGVRGAALATAIGTFVSCVLAFWFATRKNGYLRFRLRLPEFDRQSLSGLLRVGSSSMLESVCLRVGFFINARMIADLGKTPLAAYYVVQQVTMLSFTLGDGVSAAGATLVGQSLGAGRKDHAVAYVQAVRKISLFASTLLMIIICFTRNYLADLFTDEAALIAGASIAFIVVITGIIPQNGRVVYSGCLRGAGDVSFVAMCALISVTLIRPVLTWIFCYPADRLLPTWQFAFTGPWIAFVIDAYIRQALLSHRIKQGKFLTIKL